MKKNWLLFFWIVWFLLFSVCSATSWWIELSSFLYRTPRPRIPVPWNDSICKEGESLKNLFDLFQENWIFFYRYYINPWQWKNVWLLKDYAKKEQNINYLKKAVFPYVDDKLINEWNSISLYCTGWDFIYQAWVFDVTWTIIVENKEGIYNVTWEIEEERKLNYKEIYISLDEVSDKIVRNLPYASWNNLFIGCEDDSKNRLYRNWRHRNVGVSEAIMIPQYRRYIDSYTWKSSESQQELSQYEWKKINVRFYLSPWYLKKDYKLGANCENIWMLQINVKVEQQ